jgi:hypothetical protein
VIFDAYEEPPTTEELNVAIHDAQRQLQRTMRRAVYVSIAFLLNCGSVAVFLYPFPLNRYWNSFGRYLLFPCGALLVFSIMYVGMAINSWCLLRSLRKITSQ